MTVSTALRLALAAAVLAAAPALAQTREATGRSVVDERAETAQAYKSGDNAAIAREKVDLRAAYVADWKAKHPGRQPSPEEIDATLNRERGETAQAYRSGDKAAIERQRGELRAAYAADWNADHPRGGKPDAAGEADRRLAAQRTATSAAYKTGDKVAIAKAKLDLNAAYQASWAAHHPRG